MGAIQDGWTSSAILLPIRGNFRRLERTRAKLNTKDHTYEAALSFAGEQREYVQRVAAGLETAGVPYFYDERAAIAMWGEDLVIYLDRVYRRGSRFVVVFVSAAYATKVWPRAEFRSALAGAIEEKGPYILPVRFDDTELPGLLPTVGYLDARRTPREGIAAALLEKLGRASPQVENRTSTRMPRVSPADFNPYAETQRAFGEIREVLSQRAQKLGSGLVGHAEERGGRGRSWCGSST
ncbi:MAG: TIR domain-containing protein [Candidatus Eisenbacteria bacterium]|uniref:TIR domain-containing protein n=1 Tax=Eiseniibacteriota bacterium TaxID=2212470 RepID=A0A538U3K7_UNCEI|nr:MAG: TIR domain-containing protein [Candidatus Eisenbacteria bacterium]